MGRRGKRTGMAALGNSMKTHDRRHRQSNMMRASGFGRKKKGKSAGLSGYLGLGSNMFGRRNKGMVGQVGSSLRERWSPTERAEIEHDSERTLNESENQGAGDNAFTRFLRSVISRMRRS